MHRILGTTLVGSALVLSWGLAGCQTEMDSDVVQTTDDVSTEGYESVSEEEQIADNLAQLSESDQELAAQQVICPVANKKLGWMGVPSKTTVAGHEVLLCCSGCEKAVQDNPEKYLAVIGLTPKTDAAPDSAPN